MDRCNHLAERWEARGSLFPQEMEGRQLWECELRSGAGLSSYANSSAGTGRFNSL